MECSLCSAKLLNRAYLLQHIRQAHSHRPGFNIICGFSGCQRTFQTFGNYRNHVYGFHCENETLSVNNPPLPVEGGFDVDMPGIDSLENEVPNGDHTDTNSCSHVSRKDSEVLWILKVQEKHKLPQATLEGILKDVTYFCQVGIWS